MILLDTNVFVALVNKSDALHSRARQAIIELQEPIYLHEHVYIETLTVLATKYGMLAVEKFVSFVAQGQVVLFLPSNASDLSSITSLFRTRSAGKLSFVDATLLYWSRSYNVLTFDKELARAIKRQRR